MRMVISPLFLRGRVRLRSSASGKRAFAVMTIPAQSSCAATLASRGGGGASALSIWAGAPGPNSSAAIGRNTSTAPVTSDSSNSGATITPRSR
jgi:hypothetical protein